MKCKKHFITKTSTVWFGNTSCLRAGNRFKMSLFTDVSSSRLSVSSRPFYNRNINHHFPLLASSSRGPVSLLDSTSGSLTEPRGGGCQLCTCQPSTSVRGLNQAHSSSLFIMAASSLSLCSLKPQCVMTTSHSIKTKFHGITYCIQ